MFRRAVLRLCCLLATPMFAYPAIAADLGVQPTLIQLDAQRDRATVQVHNRGIEPVTLQADGVDWSRNDGRDIDGVTADLLVNPPVFTVAPGATQLVRVGLRRNQPAEAEKMFRLVLRELPPAPTDGLRISGQVRVLVALRLPVYVAPRVVRRDAQWALERESDGRYVARVTNVGNVHLRLAGLRLRDAAPDAVLAVPGGDADLLAEHGPVEPVYPGETRRLPLQASRPLPEHPLLLELREADEVRRVGVAVARR